MALGQFVAGRYLGARDGIGLGITREGYSKRMTTAQELINMSDAFGESIIDGVYRGGNITVDFIAKEYLDSVKTALSPWAARGVLSDATTPIGRLASQVTKSLVLSAQPFTSAATSPLSHTALATVLAANFDVQTLFDSRLREMPVRLQYLPIDMPAPKVGWFTEA